ncbi:hypothetical protein EJ03DRAFT_84321 [Teratosphaeria nubilosa]|uniref:MARVEL domain-containing protein n=1 Tax=Teratosphaeria nubilosa TaxID=161662 RepID=A0A6G1LAD7_9PEZI|nr:hypothetical protein EJ03DRAFT_84321 [Teratosphaeria nubilosa]
MSTGGQRKKPTFILDTRPRADSDDSTAPSTKAGSLKSPRTARFAEATAVNSPIEPKKFPFSKLKVPNTNHYMAQPQPGDVGFGYMNRHESVEMPDTDNNDYPSVPKSPLKSPLKSALKTPGAPPKDLKAILSPTFKEEEILEKQEAHTEKRQKQDLRIKVRVRIAKLLLRGVNFSCSLIVLGMLSSTFAIFNATKHIPPRNDLPPWAVNQKTWPQVVLLCISCVSLFCSLVIFYAYWRGGFKRAEKAAVYYSAFAVAFFVFSIVMWGIGAGILQGAKTTSNNKDMWGWACVNNTRRQLFQNEVSYDLVCRLQNWSLVCCIMYLAQLRTQSAPNTPGLMSPRGGFNKHPADYWTECPEVEEGVRYVDPDQKAQPQPFKLQAPPVRVTGATPKMAQVGFAPIQTTSRERLPSPPEPDQRSPLMAEAPREQRQEHFAAAPGEQLYDSVAIPGAYEEPMSPGHEQRHMQW